MHICISVTDPAAYVCVILLCVSSNSRSRKDRGASKHDGRDPDDINNKVSTPLEIIPPSLKTAMVTCTILGASSIRGHSHSPT